MKIHRFVATVSLVIALLCGVPAFAQSQRQETVRDHLWIWGHPAGAYNDNFLKGVTRNSTIEPVAAAEYMGLRNMIFVRFRRAPQPPFHEYYKPFKKLDRVYWSLVDESGSTSAEEREQVYGLAEDNANIAGFILDDFIHEKSTEDRHVWLAENDVEFPVTLTLTPPHPVACDSIELVQSNWKTGDYRSKDFEVELSANGKDFKRVSRGTLPNQGAARVAVKFPQQKFAALRIRILSSHDAIDAKSCGLSAVELFDAGKPLKLDDWKAAASSSFATFHAASLVTPAPPFRASLTPEQLKDLAARKVRGKHLPTMAVIYTDQISRRSKPYIDEVDEICLWTWRPADIEHLEGNLAALEELAGDRSIYLGCYMYDFANRLPLKVEAMQRQTELGYKWLKVGRIQGIILLATPNVDVDLEAVEWTRKWIAKAGDEPLAVE